MAPEKLNGFRKLLAGLGKRLYWKMSNKMNLYMLSTMAFGVTKVYETIFNGDTGLAVDTFTEQFMNGANSIMYELLPTMKIFFSKSLEDVEFLSGVAMYVILGPKWQNFFGPPKFVPASRSEAAKLIITYKCCVLCTGLKPGVDIDPTKLRTNSYGELLARALVSLMQLIQDYVGNQYTLQVKETKCRLRGDSYGECFVYFYPKTEAKP